MSAVLPTPSEKKHQGLVAQMQATFGPTICAAFEDPTVVEIMLNDNGQLLIERHGKGIETAGTVPGQTGRNVIGLVASWIGDIGNSDNPIVEGALPPEFGGARFEGVLPPCSPAPIFAIRLRARSIYTLADYLKSGIITSGQHDTILGAVEGHKNILVSGGTGCHAPDELLLTFDGSLKRAEDVREGDRLMGPDGRPRRVIALHSGIDEMVRITPKKGEPFVVNAGHILSLVSTPTVKGQTRRAVEITVRDWMASSKRFKHTHKLRRVAVPFSEKSVPIDPYFLGLLLGDGYLGGGSIGICKPDPEILARIEVEAAARGLHVSAAGRGTSVTYRLCGDLRGAAHTNSLIHDTSDLGLRGTTSGDKFIPQDYKTASRSQRMALLAGLLDTDGSLVANGGYDYVTKSQRLAEDIQFVCRSLGFAAQVSPCEKSCGDFRGTYYRLYIGGPCGTVPCRIPRKSSGPGHPRADVRVTGFSAECIGPGRYCGFEVDGDHLYLDRQFIVHHNSGKTTMGNAVLHHISTVSKLDDRIVLIEDTPELQCAAPNVVSLLTRDEVDMTRLLKATLRLRPNRIVVGEVRDKAALALLKAWNTGHPGGLATLHANNPQAALLRLDQLCQEAGVPSQSELVRESVDLVIQISRAAVPAGRRVDALLDVKSGALL